MKTTNNIKSVPGFTYTRAGSATAWRKDGTLVEFAPNVPRITDKGVLIEGQATNLIPYSRQGRAEPRGTVAVPVANSNHVEDGRACMSGTFPEITNGDINGCQVLFGGWVSLQKDLIYSWAATIKLSRPLVDGESVYVWLAGWQDLGRVTITASSQQNGWSRIGATKTSTRNDDNALFVVPGTLLSPLTVYCTDLQVEQASDASSPIITTGAAATRGVDNLSLSNTLPNGDFTLLWETECAAPTGVSNWSLTSDASVEAFVGGNQGFEDGLTGWVSNALGAALHPGVSFATTFQGRSNVAITPAPADDLFTAKIFPVDTSRKYVIRAFVWVGEGTGSVANYIGYVGFDAAGNTLHDANSASWAASIEGAGATISQLPNAGWVEYKSKPITGEGLQSFNQFRPGTKGIRLAAFVNGGANRTVEMALDGIWLEDVTESEAAKVLPAQTIQIGARAPSSGTPISRRRRHALRKQGPTLTEYLDGVPIKNRQGSAYNNLLIGGGGFEPINGVVETVKIIPFAMRDAEIARLAQ